MKVIGQRSYTLRFRSSLLHLWKTAWLALLRPPGIVPVLALVGAFFTYILAIVLTTWKVIEFAWMTVTLMFAGVVGVVALIFSLVTLFRIGTTLCIVEFGPEGCRSQMGRVSLDLRWQDIERVIEREGSIVIEYKAGGGIKIPDRAFADAPARHKFLDDVLRWHEIAHAANTEHA